MEFYHETHGSGPMEPANPKSTHNGVRKWLAITAVQKYELY